MRLGIFGGTFDPPHIGHLILASEAQAQLELDRVLWVLTPQPPHKLDQAVSPIGIRFDLLQAALIGDPGFEISQVDIDRSPPHYAVETVRLLHKRFPKDRLVYLMGGDSLDDLTTWHSPQEFVMECDEIGVMVRPGRRVDLDELEQQLPGVRERVRFLKAPKLEISSSQLRQKIFDGGAYRYYLPPAVLELIEQRSLYRNDSLSDQTSK
jgi:nicotinate-nucleotide adenylyltransferase